MPYALVIFDLDGTLADSFPWFTTVMNAVARKYGFREVGEDEVEALRNMMREAGNDQTSNTCHGGKPAHAQEISKLSP